MRKCTPKRGLVILGAGPDTLVIKKGRRDQFRAERLAAERAAANEKLAPVWDPVVEAIEGDGVVERVRLRNGKTDEISTLDVAGVFMSVGTSPHVEFLAPGQVEQREGGWTVTGVPMNTSAPGLFAAGDVRDTPLRQVVTAASDEAVAAMSAYHYIESHGQSLELTRRYYSGN